MNKPGIRIGILSITLGVIFTLSHVVWGRIHDDKSTDRNLNSAKSDADELVISPEIMTISKNTSKPFASKPVVMKNSPIAISSSEQYSDEEVESLLLRVKESGNFPSQYASLLPYIVDSKNIDLRIEYYDAIADLMFGLSGRADIEELKSVVESLLTSESDGYGFAHLMLYYQNFMDEESKGEYTEQLLSMAPSDLSEFGKNEIRAYSVSNATSSQHLNFVLGEINQMDSRSKSLVFNSIANRLYYWAAEDQNDPHSVLSEAKAYLDSVNPFGNDGVDGHQNKIDPSLWLRTNGLVNGGNSIEENEMGLLKTAEESSSPDVVVSILESIMHECEYVDVPFVHTKCSWYRGSSTILDKLSSWQLNTDIQSLMYGRIHAVKNYFYS